MKHLYLSITLLLLMCVAAFSQAPNVTYQTPQNYLINAAISPLSPNNTGGAVPGIAYGLVTDFAGTGVGGSTNGAAATATFNRPTRLALDLAGNAYVADRDNNLIRKISTAGVVSTYAGGFNQPNGVAVDALGNLYVADALSNSIKIISILGTVTTVAGGSQGSSNGIGASASFFYPYGVAVDALGFLYIADTRNNLIRKIAPGGIVSTLAGSGAYAFADGTGTAAAFRDPNGITLDALGNVYVTDATNNRVRKITPLGVVTTFAGTGVAGSTNGALVNATFNGPSGIAFDPLGNFYTADIGGNQIRKIDASGIVTTLAGNGSPGAVNGIGGSATFDHPNDVQYVSAGYLLITDLFNNKIRKVSVTGYTIDKALPTGLTFDAATGIISGTPTVLTPATTYTVTAYNINGKSATTVVIAVTAGLPPNISYQTPQNYTITTAINPLAPTNIGGAVTVSGLVSTFAGGRAPVTFDATGTNAGFNSPSGITADGTGNIYVSDYGSGAIRKITPSAVVTTINNVNNPSGLTIDSQGNLFVTDFQNNYIYKITPGGVKSIFAGNGSAGSANGTGNAASFSGPGGISIDAAGNLFVADQTNNLIRKITSAGAVTTLAGSGAAGTSNGTGLSASFYAPDGLCADNQGNVYVADTKNNLIRKITPTGVVTTVAGSGLAANTDGTGNGASFNYPTSVVIDAANNLYVADYHNNEIRMITPAGVVTTIAGSGTSGSTNGNGNVASFNSPLSLTFDLSGNLYVTDFANYLVRKITIRGYTIDKTLPAGLSFNMVTGIITGTPTVISPATNYTITGYNAFGSSTTVVSIQVAVSVPALLPQVLIFPPLNPVTYGAADVVPGAISTNILKPITYTSSNTSVATITADGKIHVTGVGQSTITASQAGDALFSPATPVSQVFTVNPATLNVNIASQTKVYGAANPAFTFTYSGFVYSETASVVTTAPTLSTTAITTSPVGNYAINGTGATAANYIFAYNAGTLNITAAPLTITADNQTRVYGAANPPLTLKYTGFVAGDDATKLTTQAMVTTSANASSAIGTYAITVSGASSPNYVISYVPGVLTITGLPRTLTFNPIPTKSVTDADFDPGATVDTNDPITYTSSDPSIAVIIGGKVHILKVGSVTITATVASRVNYADITPKSQMLLILVDPQDLVRIPPVVTPNGDGINDVLRIDGINNYPENKLTLINANSIAIYDIAYYDNVKNVFDGHSSITGKLQPQGTYYYSLQFKVNGEWKKKVGFVVLKY